MTWQRTEYYRDYHRAFFLAAGLLVAFYAMPAFALSYIDGNNVVTCPRDEEDGYIYTVVTCLQEAITSATIVFLSEFSDAMYSVILALITFQVTLFGVQATMGVAEVEKKAVALLIKIGVVLTFGQNLGGFAPDVFDIMQEAIDLIVGLAVDPESLTCEAAQSADSSLFAYDGVWRKMDCLLEPLFRILEPEKLFNSIYGLAGSAFSSGSLGVMVFLTAAMALLNILLFAYYAAYMYVLSLIYVGFLIILSPLLMPFLLVGVNIGIFEKWLHSLLAGMAIPVFVMVFLVLVYPALDKVINQHDESIGKVLGDDYTSYYRNPQQWCSQQVGTDYDGYVKDNYKDIPEKTIDHVMGPLKNILTPMMSGNTDYCSPLETPSVDFREGHVAKLMDIADSMILLLVTAYLFNAIMKQMATLGASIFGGGFQIAALGEEGLFLESALRGGMKKGGSAPRMIGGNKGGLGMFKGTKK